MTLYEVTAWITNNYIPRDFYQHPMSKSELEQLDRFEDEALNLVDIIRKVQAAAAEAEIKRNREKFMITLGVNYNGAREAVYEIVFDTLLEAVQVAANARGIFAERLTEQDTRGHKIEQVTSVPEGALYEVIAGATVEVFTDAEGTTNEYDLY